MKKNTIKVVKAYGIYIKGKLFDVSMNKPLPTKDIEVIPVLITPITKVAKNKENKNNG